MRTAGVPINFKTKKGKLLFSSDPAEPYFQNTAILA
jgi:hypothetical protein